MNRLQKSAAARSTALEEIEALIAACEAELIGDACQDEPDHAPVACSLYAGEATPADSLTFGLIRRARAALIALKKDEPHAIADDTSYLRSPTARRSFVETHLPSPR